jgi:SIR2-like domain
MSEESDLHFSTVISAITGGRIVPFLGAGANLCDRPQGVKFVPGGKYLPTGGELAEFLAHSFGVPTSTDLARVAQYIALVGGGTGALYEALGGLFNHDYPPTLLHKFLAILPGYLRDKGYNAPYLLMVTTNYDDVLERSFHAAREPFDLVAYMAEGEERGKFWHWPFAPPEQAGPAEGDFWERWPPHVEPRLIESPNEYIDVSLDRRHVILKIHGAVDRVTPVDQLEGRRDSYVITEDDYIEYLMRTDLSNLVPVKVRAKLVRANFLFLGYSLRDWNMRVILRRIWNEQKLKWGSWAINLKVEDIERAFWIKRDVQMYPAPLKAYVSELLKRLEAEEYVSRLEKRLGEMEPPLPVPPTDLKIPQEDTP